MNVESIRVGTVVTGPMWPVSLIGNSMSRDDHVSLRFHQK
jgi:hypothetical protein